MPFFIISWEEITNIFYRKCVSGNYAGLLKIYFIFHSIFRLPPSLPYPRVTFCCTYFTRFIAIYTRLRSMIHYVFLEYNLIVQKQQLKQFNLTLNFRKPQPIKGQGLPADDLWLNIHMAAGRGEYHHPSSDVSQHVESLDRFFTIIIYIYSVCVCVCVSVFLCVFRPRDHAV